MTIVRVVVLGSGSSASVPSLTCLLQGDKESADGAPCHVCKEAHANPDSKNRRNNPSLLIQFPRKDQPDRTAAEDASISTEDHQPEKQKQGAADGAASSDMVNIVIDIGKTFRETALRLFPKLGVKTIDAVCLTHDHADAVLGLDDIRSMQAADSIIDEHGGILHVPKNPIHVFLSDETFHHLKGVFPYLMPKKHNPRLASGEPPVKQPKRFVASLDWQVIAEVEQTRTSVLDPPFSACGLTIQPLRLLHGGDYISLGFVFGPDSGKCAYLSDVKIIPETVMAYLKSIRIDVLILDSLFIQRNHATHMCIDESIDAVIALDPRRTIFTGMTHDFDYYTFHEEVLRQKLEARGLPSLSIEMGFDGLEFELEVVDL